jgi:membrane protein
VFWALVRGVRDFAGRVTRVRVTLLAASLAYYATFSLFPLLLLAVAGFGFALERNVNLREQVLNFLSSSVETAFPTAADLLNSTLRDLKTGLLERLQLNAGVSGVIGLVALVWASSGFFTVLQDALNDAIPGVRSRPIWMARVVAIATVAAFGALLMILMLSGVIVSSLAGLPGLGFLKSFSSSLLTVLGASMLFTLAYRFLPAHSPGWRAALVAGVPTAVVWQLARSVLGLLTPIATYQATYGVLAGFLLLLAWLYLSMQIFLMGAVLAGMLEGRFKADAPNETEL